MDEDADLLGLSSLSGAHDFLFSRVCTLLVEAELKDVVVFGGGIIPEADRAPLLESGIRAIFGPGTTIEEMLSFVSELIVRRTAGEPSGVGEGGDWTWQGTGAV